MYPFAINASSMNDCHRFQYVPPDERQRLERLVVGAEPAGEQHDRVRLLDEHELAGEEVPHRHQLRVAGDDWVGGLLERQQDVHAEAVRRPGADVPGLHDPRRRAGNDHVPSLGHQPAELDGGLVGGVI
jgi:hypothetical protein